MTHTCFYFFVSLHITGNVTIWKTGNTERGERGQLNYYKIGKGNRWFRTLWAPAPLLRGRVRWYSVASRVALGVAALFPKRLREQTINEACNWT